MTGRQLIVVSVLLGLTVMLVMVQPASAGSYGYSYYRPSYGYGYQPSYSYAYYPATYSYYQPSYYGYQAPGYQYTYHNAGWSGGRWYPAGMYAYANGQWYLQGYGPFAGYDNAPAASVPSYTDSGWRSKLLDVARLRDEQIAYLKALQALGTAPPGNYPPNLPPGAGPMSYAPPGHYASPQYGTFGAQGNTVYGYTYETLKSQYGETNLNTLYQQAARLTQGAQQLAGQAHTEFSGVVNQAGDNAARVAEVLARGQAAAAVLRSTEPQASTTTQTRTTVTGSGTSVSSGATQSPSDQGYPQQPGSSGQPAPQYQQQGGNAEAFLQQLGRPACGSCHSGKDPKGKFDINTYPQMSPEQKRTVWERLLSPDPDKHMPRDNAGKPAQLTVEQLRAFLLN